MRMAGSDQAGLGHIARATAAAYRALRAGGSNGDTLMSPEALETVSAMIGTWGVPVFEMDQDEAERTWIWSDLHFKDGCSVKELRRPFRYRWTHDRALQRRWRERIREDDWMIHGGDFASESVNERKRQELLDGLPGTKVNVLGNHDVRSLLTPLTEGWSATYGGLVLASTPPLVVTHCPLRTVPAGTVNVHGHMHRRRDRTGDPRINVAVEQTGYQPVSAATIIEEARRRLQGERPRALEADRRNLNGR